MEAELIQNFNFVISNFQLAIGAVLDTCALMFWLLVTY